MGKLIKLLLGLTLLLILIIAVTAVGAILYFDPNQHKDFIISRVENATGRKFAITGNIDLTYYPWLGLKAEGITLGNTKEFGDKPLLHADLVALRIKTMPLFKKHYELDTLKLHGLELNLAKNKQGITNWQDFVGAKKEKQERIPFAAVVLGGVDIKDAKLNWQDETTGQEIMISSMNVSTGELTYGAPIHLEVSLKADANKPAIKSNLKLDGTLNYDLDAEIYSFKPIELNADLAGPNIPGGSTNLVFKAAVESNLGNDTVFLHDLGLEILGTSIQGELTANKVKSGNPEANGQFRIQGDDLAELLKVLEIPSGNALASQPDRTFDIQTKIQADLAKDTILLPDLNAKIFGSKISGLIEIGNLRSTTPAVKTKLQAEGNDMLWLMQLTGQNAAAKELANVKDRSFKVKIDADANMEKGDILVNDLDAVLLDTKMKGSADISKIHSTNPAIKTRMSIQGNDLLNIASLAGQESTMKTLSGIKDRSFLVNIDADADLESGRLQLPMVDARFLDTTIKAQLVSEDVQSGAKGTVSAHGSDLALLFKVAGIQPLGDQLSALADRSFDVKAALDANMSKGIIKVSDMQAKVLGSNINGAIETRDIKSPKPAASGFLNATGPDLPALMQVLGQFESGDQSKLKEYGKRLSGANDKSFDIATKFDADFKNGNINIPDLKAKSLGLTISGNLESKDIASSNGKVDGKLSIQGENISSLLEAFGQAGLGKVMKKIDINAGLKGAGGDISLSPFQLKATFAGKQIPNSPVDMTLLANARANMEKQTLVVENLTLDGLGLNLKSNLNASQIKDNPAFTGDLTVAEFNLRKFAEQMNQTLPDTADPKVFRKVGLKTAISGDTDSIKLENLVMNLDETKIQGTMSINHFSQPNIKFDVGIDSINADRYLPPKAKGKPVTPETAAGGAATELPLDTLRSLHASGDLVAGQLTISNATLRNIKITLKAKDGDIHLDPVSAELYEGTYQGNVALDARGKVPKIIINSQLSSVQLDPLLKDYMQQPESPLAGVADLTFESLTANGSNTTQMKHTLNGKGSFKIKDGILRGVDVNKTLRQVEIMIESKRFGNLDKSGETRFKKLDGTLDIKNGVVFNKDMRMKGYGFNITGEGILANLNDETLKYDMLVKVDETTTTEGEENYNIGGYDLPVRCRGQLSKPDCQPDAGDIAKVLFKKTGEEKLKEILGDTLGVESTAPATQTNSTSGTDTTTTQQEPVTTKKKRKQTQTAPTSPDDLLKKGLEDAVKGIFE